MWHVKWKISLRSPHFRLSLLSFSNECWQRYSSPGHHYWTPRIRPIDKYRDQPVCWGKFRWYWWSVKNTSRLVLSQWQRGMWTSLSIDLYCAFLTQEKNDREVSLSVEIWFKQEANGMLLHSFAIASDKTYRCMSCRPIGSNPIHSSLYVYTWLSQIILLVIQCLCDLFDRKASEKWTLAFHEREMKLSSHFTKVKVENTNNIGWINQQDTWIYRCLSVLFNF